MNAPTEGFRGSVKVWFLGFFGALVFFAAQPLAASAYTETECLSPGVAGQCRVSCDKGENEVGTCSDNWVYVTCCSKKVIPQGQSLNPTPGAQPGGTQTGGAPATGGGPGSATTLIDPLKGVTLNGLIGRAINVFLGFVGAIALLVFVYAGILYMTGGTSDRIKKAVETMKYAVLGLMIIMFAYAITTFYFKILTSDVPTAAPPKNVATPQIQTP
ncbi:hypothetical protein HZC53_01570 [Candidatus Uhrbacteria bacterium]|nr:hypothetical protein [Candidatus Uhrbacteria bacterium]